MFSEQTETELRRNLQWEAGMQGLVTLPADAYRELVLAARRWDAAQSPVQISHFNTDGSVTMTNGRKYWPVDGATWTPFPPPIDTPPPTVTFRRHPDGGEALIVSGVTGPMADNLNGTWTVTGRHDTPPPPL
jgi:hypothetical protein